MRSGLAIAVAALLALLVEAVAPATTSMATREQQVLAALNLARADPAAYSRALQGYRGFYHAGIVTVPGQRISFATLEGVRPVDEAIGYLRGHPALPPMRHADMLATSAAAFAGEQARTGGIGHYGQDGSSPGDRVRSLGGGEMVAEVIAYGATDAADVIRQLIIDDGVRDRGHRALIFSPHLRYAGVACRAHARFGSVCVIDLADAPDGRPFRPVLLADRR